MTKKSLSKYFYEWFEKEYLERDREFVPWEEIRLNAAHSRKDYDEKTFLVARRKFIREKRLDKEY